MAASNNDGKGGSPPNASTSHRSQQIQLLSLLGIMLCVFTVLYIQVERQHHGHFTSSLVMESFSHWATFHNQDPAHRLAIPITLWSSDFHISPIADIKSIVSKWGVTVIDKSLSGHCHLTSTCARDLKVINQQNGISLPCANSLRRSFYDAYREDSEFRSADAFVCTHADSMCELFMPFNRPLIVVASTRYEIGRLEASHWNRWNHNLKKIITKSEWNSVGANNQYDRAYMQFFTDFTEQQLFYLPNLCQYVTARYQYPPHRNEILLAPYRGINAVLERKLFKTLQAFREHQTDLIAQHNMTAPATSLLGRHEALTIRKISDVYPNHYEYSELASHPAVVLLPYQVSIMSFFEFYHMNIPIFVPSPALLTKWHLHVHILHERTWMSVYEMPQHSSTIPRHPNSSCSLHGDPNDEFSAAAIEEWIKLSDYYTWPHVTTFDSWEDLFAKLWTADLLSISRRMEQYNLELKERVEGEWFRILTKVAEAKRQRLAEEEAWTLQQQSHSQPKSSVVQEDTRQHLRKSTDSTVVPSTNGGKTASISSSSQAMPQMSLEGLGIDVTAELSALNEKNAAASVSAEVPGVGRDPSNLPDDINDSLQQSYGIRLVEHSCEDQMEVAFYITGTLDGLTCDSESVQSANSAQLHSILSEIADSTFFRLVRVNGENAQSFCPIDELRPPGTLGGSCGAVVDAFESFAPKSFTSSSPFDPFGSSAPEEKGGHEGGLCSIEPEPTAQSIAETVVTHISPEEVSAQQEFPRDNECVLEGTFKIRPDYWLDICGSEAGGEYVNLKLNPERNTGYNGSLVWQEMHKTVLSLQSEEGTVLQRLLSGYHASVTTQIMSSYFPPSSSANKASSHGSSGKKTARWKSNPKKFAEKYFLAHPDRIQDMHFAFVVLSRSLFRMKDFLYSYNFTTGNQTADTATQQLVHHLLDSSVLHSCGSVLSGFDESTMFTNKHHSEEAAMESLYPAIYVERLGTVAKEFKRAFRRISRMVNCVTCHRCQLHARVAMHGIGVALKVLLTDPVHLVTQSLSRDDIVALVNTVHKFSESIELANELVAAYYASGPSSIDSKGTAGRLATPDTNIDRQASVSISADSLSKANALLSFIAEHRQNLTRIEEDALIHALVHRDERILLLANHFSNWTFVRHALISLGLEQPDAVVVGGGLAGLVTAVSIADQGGSVVVLEKLSALGGNSAKASSGINAVKSDDSAALQWFLDDTVKSQGGHGDPLLANQLVASSKEAVTWLEEMTQVNLSSIGQLGGHRVARTWKPEHGVVGAELMSAMIRLVKQRHPAITVLTHATVTNLILNDDNHTVEGVEFLLGKDQPVQQSLYARNVVLASGGFGFDHEGMLKTYRPDLVSYPTTLGAHTTGDGIRLAERIGAELVDMQYVQLHPTGFIDPHDRGNHVKVLAAEVVRGIGGILLSPQGTRFVNELGTRKAVVDQMLVSAAATNNEERAFWLVISSHSVPLAERLLQIYVSRGLLRNVTSAEALMSLVGKDALSSLQMYSDASVDAFGRQDRLGLPMHQADYWLVGEVTPVVHYTMGGIKIDTEGHVLHRNGTIIDRLYAVGEVSGGVHGENRLGGNSLLECTVFGRMIGAKSIQVHPHLSPSHFPRRVALQSPWLANESVASGTKPAGATPNMTMKEIEQHNTVADCWTVIDNKVYDLSQYAEDHPGGAAAIKDSCGKDSTQRFLVAHSFGLLEDADFRPIGKLAP